jgi:hypothetical protein
MVQHGFALLDDLFQGSNTALLFIQFYRISSPFLIKVLTFVYLDCCFCRSLSSLSFPPEALQLYDDFLLVRPLTFRCGRVDLSPASRSCSLASCYLVIFCLRKAPMFLFPRVSRYLVIFLLEKSTQSFCSSRELLSGYLSA